MQKKIHTLVVTLILATWLGFPGLAAAGSPAVPATHSTAALKKFMGNFGAMMAGLEIMHVKEQVTDWEVVQLTLSDMSRNLEEMRKADTENAYREYTDVLKAGLVKLQGQADSKNKDFWNSVDDLRDTCFKCHAAHRPGDYLMPSKKQQLSDQSQPAK